MEYDPKGQLSTFMTELPRSMQYMIPALHNLLFKHFLCWYHTSPICHAPIMTSCFIKILKYVTGIWKRSFHVFWDYPCGCHHCPCKHDICIWVTSDAFWTRGIRVLLHICFCVNYKAGLINDKEMHCSTTVRRSPCWASSWPHIARPQVFHVIGELASHHPLLFSQMSASLWGLHHLPVVVIAPFTIISAVFRTHLQLFSSLGEKFSCKICFQVLHSKTLIDECTFKVNCLKFQMRFCKFLRSCKHKYSPTCFHNF